MAGGAPAAHIRASNIPTGGRALWVPIALVTSLFFLWGFAYGLLDVLNKHFQNVLGLTKLESTGLQIAYFGAYIVYPPTLGGWIIRRFGYKLGIISGLVLYVVGACFFWPSAHFLSFGGFCGSTFVLACGLSMLEIAANAYITVLGPAETATFRLNLSQSFNGVGSFTGPLIASKAFFSGEGSKDLTSVQYVYIGIAAAVAAVAVGFYFVSLPEISDEEMQERAAAEGSAVSKRPLWKQYHTIAGFVAQFFYVGGQVSLASFFINYVVEVDPSVSDAKASTYLSYSLILFTVGRFFATALLKFLKPQHILSVYAAICAIFAAVSMFLKGTGGVALYMAIFFFESCMYPTIFTMAIANLGINTKKGTSLLIMGVGGGAIMPPIQGAISDHLDTQKSTLVPLICFVVVLVYGLFFTQPFGVKPEERDLEMVEESATGVEYLDQKGQDVFVENVEAGSSPSHSPTRARF
ncbi:hypothetical protein YB2330_004621 [Saitoella coloradoensis]